MITVEEAIKRIESCEISSKVIELDTLNSMGYILAEDIIAPISMPSFRQSAMDGYAICGNQKEYKVVEEVPAGDTRLLQLEQGEAARIFTGAPVPKGANAVIMQEKASREGDIVTIDDEIKENKNIRPIGEQLKEKDKVFEKGDTINPPAIGLLYSLGIAKVRVIAQPKIALLITGDELKQVGEELQYGEIYESNSATIQTALQLTGFPLAHKIFIKDDYQGTKNAIKDAMGKCDVLILSGGISVGEYDFVKKALEENGVKDIFYKVKQKPGKPLYFGQRGTQPIFALPGNPAAALTCYYFYVLPLLNKISGKGFQPLDKRTLKLKSDIRKRAGRSHFLRALAQNDYVTLLEGQASSMLWSYAKANCLAFLPEQAENLAEGDEVEVYYIPKC